MRTNLKLLRVKLGYSQGAFAKEIGVSRQVYGYIERGERNGSPQFWDSVQTISGFPDSEMYPLQKLM